MNKNKSIILRDTQFKSIADGHGGNRRTLQIEEILSKAGFEVHDLRGEMNIVQDFLVKNFHSRLVTLFKVVPNFIKYLPYVSPAYKLFLSSALKMSQSANSLENNKNVKVIVWEDNLNYLMPYVAKSQGQKVVSLPHNFDSLAGRSFDLSKRKKNLDSLSNEVKHLAQADRIFCISREEQWFLRLCGLNSDYLPYYPPSSVVSDLLKVREAREKSYNNCNADSNRPRQFLVLGSYINTPTKVGMIELVKWLKSIEEELPFDVEIAGFGTQNLKDEIELGSRFKILGSLSNQELFHAMVRTSTILVHQTYGLGSLTKIPEMLIAGIPIIANSIASRSYFDYDGIHRYENSQELAKLLKEDFCSPKMPLPPIHHENRFVDYLTRLIDG
jgi:hypothetical protein